MPLSGKDLSNDILELLLTLDQEQHQCQFVVAKINNFSDLLENQYISRQFGFPKILENKLLMHYLAKYSGNIKESYITHMPNLCRIELYSMKNYILAPQINILRLFFYYNNYYVVRNKVFCKKPSSKIMYLSNIRDFIINNYNNIIDFASNELMMHTIATDILIDLRVNFKEIANLVVNTPELLISANNDYDNYIKLLDGHYELSNGFFVKHTNIVSHYFLNTRFESIMITNSKLNPIECFLKNILSAKKVLLEDRIELKTSEPVDINIKVVRENKKDSVELEGEIFFIEKEKKNLENKLVIFADPKDLKLINDYIRLFFFKLFLGDLKTEVLLEKMINIRENK